MNRSLPLATLLVSLASSTPSAAEEPAKTPVQTEAESTVQKKLLKPLLAREEKRSRMSRARLPPSARRIRVTDPVAKKDGKGGEFVTFAVDSRYGWDELEDDAPKKAEDGWNKNTITGCVYPGSGEVFVKYGNAFRSGEVLLGKKTEVAPGHICKADGAEVALKN